MTRLEFFQTIVAQASRGELVFPTNVDASLKLQQALLDPDCHVDAAVRLVQADPLLAARAVAVANSAAYNRSGSEIASVRAAVQRLGMRTLQALGAALMMRQLSGKNVDPATQIKAEQLWAHSAHVAALAHVIARRVTHVDPDTALFAGIVHEVGGFYMLSRAGKLSDILDGDTEDWVNHGEREIGRCVLARLEVPDAVRQAVEAVWEGMRALPPETLGDTLLLANDLSPVASPLHEREGATTLQAARTIDFVTSDGTLKSILAESAGDVASLLVALMW